MTDRNRDIIQKCIDRAVDGDPEAMQIYLDAWFDLPTTRLVSAELDVLLFCLQHGHSIG